MIHSKQILLLIYVLKMFWWGDVKMLSVPLCVTEEEHAALTLLSVLPQEKDDFEPQAPPEGTNLIFVCASLQVSGGFNTVVCNLQLYIFSLHWLFDCSFVLQSLVLQVAANWLEQEKKDLVTAKENYMSENCAAPDMSGDQAALQVRETSQSSQQPKPLERSTNGFFCWFFFFLKNQGNLQKAARSHWQDRWREVWPGGQSGKGRQRGTKHHHLKNAWRGGWLSTCFKATSMFLCFKLKLKQLKLHVGESTCTTSSICVNTFWSALVANFNQSRH